MLYRKRLKSDVWHFVKSCRWWPVKNYTAHKIGFFRGMFVSRPKSGELCNECLAKARLK